MTNRQPFREDERGVLQVMEAILAALILLGAILFVTISSSPVRDVGSSGVNLETIAEDTLNVLTSQPGLADANLTRLDEIVNDAIQGDTADAELFLTNIVPVGSRYALRLDNGIQPLHLLPVTGSATSPREASGASTYILPDWTANAGFNQTYAPGDPLDFSTWTDLVAPDGSSIGPGGDTWLDLWTADVPTQDRIPTWALFGVWDCTGGSCSDFRIALDDDITPNRPLYSVELLLWEGV